jgi:hypothetical protein
VPEFIEALEETLEAAKPRAADRAAEIQPAVAALRVLQRHHAFDARRVRPGAPPAG